MRETQPPTRSIPASIEQLNEKIDRLTNYLRGKTPDVVEWLESLKSEINGVGLKDAMDCLQEVRGSRESFTQNQGTSEVADFTGSYLDRVGIQFLTVTVTTPTENAGGGAPVKRPNRRGVSRVGAFPRIWDLMGFLILPGSRQRAYPHVRDEMKRAYYEARSSYRTRGARVYLTCCYCWWTVAALFGIWKEAGLDRLIKWLKWVLSPLLWLKLTHWLRIG